jgi:MFS family permease
MEQIQGSGLPQVFTVWLESPAWGTTIEWYDFFIYGAAAALIFNKLFFPNLDPLTGVLAAFATYAVGFIGRPLGGIVFGHFGDKDWSNHVVNHLDYDGDSYGFNWSIANL